jgi:recombination protein RecT
MTNTQQRRPSARSQVAQSSAGDEQFLAARAKVEAEMEANVRWFAKVAPSHVDAVQYVALAIGHIRKDTKLAEAAIMSPKSLMIALVDCARLGLVVGDTYHLVPFWDKHAGCHIVTGIRDYKGEIELIYRSGMVDAVFAYVVRGHEGAKTPDRFRWAPGMVFPEHVIADDGLADPADRGHLRGAYAYARLTAGGYSPVIVMSRSQVLRTRPDKAPEEFWGPPWPDEGRNTEAMWLKGPVHRLFPRVPHSTEYVAEMQRANASAAEASRSLGLPVPGVSALAGPDMGRMLEGAVELPSQRRAAAREQLPASDRPADADRIQGMVALLRDCGLTETDMAAGAGVAVARVLARESPDAVLVPVGELTAMTASMVERVGRKLSQLKRGDKPASRDDMVQLARAGGWEGGDGGDGQ